jgi:hypothetical protein
VREMVGILPPSASNSPVSDSERLYHLYMLASKSRLHQQPVDSRPAIGVGHVSASSCKRVTLAQAIVVTESSDTSCFLPSTPTRRDLLISSSDAFLQVLWPRDIAQRLKFTD